MVHTARRPCTNQKQKQNMKSLERKKVQKKKMNYSPIASGDSTTGSRARSFGRRLLMRSPSPAKPITRL